MLPGHYKNKTRIFLSRIVVSRPLQTHLIIWHDSDVMASAILASDRPSLRGYTLKLSSDMMNGLRSSSRGCPHCVDDRWVGKETYSQAQSLDGNHYLIFVTYLIYKLFV